MCWTDREALENSFADLTHRLPTVRSEISIVRKKAEGRDSRMTCKAEVPEIRKHFSGKSKWEKVTLEDQNIGCYQCLW